MLEMGNIFQYLKKKDDYDGENEKKIDEKDNVSPYTNKEKHILTLLVGNRTCIESNSNINYIIYVYGLALIISIYFIILSSKFIDNFLSKIIGTKLSYLLRIIIFFILVLITDMIMYHWRNKNIICDTSIS